MLTVIATGFANENRIVADNINILPANTYSFPFAADAEEFRSAVNNQRRYLAAAFIDLDIADKSESAAVGFINYLLAPKLGDTTVHPMIPSI